MWWPRLAGLAIAGGVAALALTAAQRPAALAQANPGLWEISGLPGAKAPLRECFADLFALAQFEHRGQSCTRTLVSDSGTSTVIEYSCSGGGFGRSQVKAFTPRSLRIETQGISDKLPFYYVLQARRVGDCPTRASASRH
jgi:hypothetical protein